jgi:hypothetical protein
LLKRVVEEFHRTVGGPVTPRVTITCPAAWGATRRLVLSDAAAAAGLGPVKLVPEPVAAATYFTQVLGRAVPVGSVVVVHDFGAGTFDASVVARTASGFEVLAVDWPRRHRRPRRRRGDPRFIRKIAVERDAARGRGWNGRPQWTIAGRAGCSGTTSASPRSVCPGSRRPT